MTVATNLLGRAVSHTRQVTQKRAVLGPAMPDTEIVLGFVCAVFPSSDPRIAPRVAIETKTGQIVTAPIDTVWVLMDLQGRPTELGETVAKEITEAEAKAATEAKNGKKPA